MRHARFDIADLSVERQELPLKAAYLLVAELDEGGGLQWEILAYLFEPVPLEQRSYVIDLTTLDGRYFRGEAVLIRAVESSLVLRGNGDLIGFDPAVDLDRD